MKTKAFVIVALAAGLCSAAWAGDIEGKVSGMKGHSVVYVDVIAGKTFPAPKDHPVMDQKGLVFAPHIMVVLQGTTVDFLNSDTVPAQRLLDCRRDRQESGTQSWNVAQRRQAFIHLR